MGSLFNRTPYKRVPRDVSAYAMLAACLSVTGLGSLRHWDTIKEPNITRPRKWFGSVRRYGLYTLTTGGRTAQVRTFASNVVTWGPGQRAKRWHRHMTPATEVL
jgi:hypothetical protein